MKTVTIRFRLVSLVTVICLGMAATMMIMAPTVAKALGRRMLESQSGFIAALLTKNLASDLESYAEDNTALRGTFATLRTTGEGEKIISNVIVYDAAGNMLAWMAGRDLSEKLGSVPTKLISVDLPEYLRYRAPIVGSDGKRVGYLQVDFSKDIFLTSVSRVRGLAFGLGFIAFWAALLFGLVCARSIARPLGGVIGVLGESAGEVSASAADVEGASRQQADDAGSHAASIEEISASLEELSASTEENAAGAGSANEKIVEVRDVVSTSIQSLTALSDVVKRVGDSSDQMAGIIKTIDEIAFQTNLLALNAAVEAARAGEAGKGFAVVANEVRTLAQRSARAAADTGALIEEARRNTGSAVQVSGEVQTALNKMVESIQGAARLMAQVATGSTQQAQGIAGVNDALANMQQTTQSSAANAQHSFVAAEQLAEHAGRMLEVVEILLRMTGAADDAPQPNTVAETEPGSAEELEQQPAVVDNGLDTVAHAPDRLLPADSSQRPDPFSP